MTTFEEELALLRKSVKAWKTAKEELEPKRSRRRHYLDTPIMECFGAGDHAAPKLDAFDCLELKKRVLEQAATVRQIVLANRRKRDNGNLP